MSVEIRKRGLEPRDHSLLRGWNNAGLIDEPVTLHDRLVTIEEWWAQQGSNL